MKKIEVLLSIMNIEKIEDYNKLLKENKITGNVLTINQTEKVNVNINDGTKRIISINEKGVSKSRNRLIENAKGDICALADDDMVYIDNYEKIIENEYLKNRKADMIIFYIENKNTNREKNKKLGNKKLNILDIMKARSSEITFRLDAIKKANIKFDEDFGPNALIKKGEETIFLRDCLNKGLKIYGVNKKIGNAHNLKSTWFTGYNKEYLSDQGAIFYRMLPRFYKILILQYVIRKHSLYKMEMNIIEAYKEMKKGAENYKLWKNKNIKCQ